MRELPCSVSLSQASLRPPDDPSVKFVLQSMLAPARPIFGRSADPCSSHTSTLFRVLHAPRLRSATHITLGCGGHRLSDVNHDQPEWLAATHAQFGYGRVTVSDGYQLAFEYVRTKVCAIFWPIQVRVSGLRHMCQSWCEGPKSDCSAEGVHIRKPALTSLTVKLLQSWSNCTRFMFAAAPATEHCHLLQKAVQCQLLAAVDPQSPLERKKIVFPSSFFHLMCW